MTQIDKNPWLGLKAYDEGTILYGRNEDTINLAQLVFYNTDAVLYGKSGIGKSSLLNANLLPRARRRGIEPIFIRLDHHENVDSYVVQIINAIKNAGIAIEKQFDTSSDTPLLWELFHCYEFFKDNKRTPLLIIFDQFEEIFTLQQNQEKRLAFFKEMADFINDIKPRQLTQENPKAEKAEGSNPILDFDELIIDDINLQIPEEYQKNYIDDNEIHLLISLREDFLSEFEYHTTSIPSLKQHRYGLRPVTDEEAQEIITMPGRDCLPVDKEEQEKLVAGIINFSKEGDLKQINTLLLSLTCYLLYQKAQKRGSERLSLQDFEQMGSNLLLEFYESLKLDKKTQSVLEQRLIDSNGRRNTINREEITVLLPNWEELTKGDKRILQVNTNNRIELVHDMLASAIYKTREHRQKKNKGRILKVYLLALLAILFIMGILGSVFTLKEDDVYQRIPINPTKSIIWPRNEQCVLNDSKYKYIENLYYEGGPDICISNHPNLKRIKISGNCSSVKLSNCPQLRYVEFEDNIKIDSLTITQCPNVQQIYLPYYVDIYYDNIDYISSDNDIRFIPNANDHSLINHNGTLWDKREIKYIANSKITNSFKTNGKVYEDFPQQLYNWQGLIKDSVKYKDIWIYSSDLKCKNQDYVVNGRIMRDPDIGRNTVLGYKDGYNTFNLSSLHIADKAFEDCKDLESIIINEHTSFGISPFIGCSNLKSITFEQNRFHSSLNDITKLLSALQDVPNDITYDIRGNGPLNKRKDGVITYDGIPVLISNESKKIFDIKRRNDTTYICTRRWFYLECEKTKTVGSYGFPNIEDTRAIQDSTILLKETENFLDARTRIYLKDTFTDGKIPTYLDYRIKVLCKNLSAKQRLWRINYPNIEFRQLADSVKKEITIIVPYGKLNEFYNDDEFIGFKDIQEASFVKTIFNSTMDTMDSALSFLLREPIILSILILVIAVVMLLCWHLSTKRIKTSSNPSNAMLRGLVEALAMIILAFVAWLAFYWLAWFWGPDFISTRTPAGYKAILSNISGIVAALVILFLMYKNALYLLKTLKLKTIKNDAAKFLLQHKKSFICTLAIIAICVISIVLYQNRQEKIAVANQLLKLTVTDLDSNIDERKKAALFVISNYLKNNKVPTKVIEDKMYTLLNTLAFETGYNMKLLHKEKNKAHSLTLSPDETRLATGCEDGIINIYDTANGQFIKTIDCDDWREFDYCKWINDSTLVAIGWNVFCININNSTFTEKNMSSYTHMVINQNICYAHWLKDSIIVMQYVINGRILEPDTVYHADGIIDVNNICEYKDNLLIGSDDGTVKMYNPQSKNSSLLYNANSKIQAIGSNDSIIAFSTSDSLYIMRHNGDKQDIKRHDIKYINSIHLSRINNIIVINKNQVATIDASLNLKNINYLNANRIKQIIPTADGECLYVVDDDNNIRYMKTEKPSKEELLETVIRNFQLENYELTEGELIKYKLYN